MDPELLVLKEAVRTGTTATGRGERNGVKRLRKMQDLKVKNACLSGCKKVPLPMSPKNVTY